MMGGQARVGKQINESMHAGHSLLSSLLFSSFPSSIQSPSFLPSLPSFQVFTMTGTLLGLGTHSEMKQVFSVLTNYFITTFDAGDWLGLAQWLDQNEKLRDVRTPED